MELNDLIELFEAKRKQWGKDAFLHISEIFEEAREKYKEEYLRSPKAQRIRASGKIPDADLVIYKPATYEVIGIISCKITLRERVAQTAYWKLKLVSDPITAHIKGYFVTADEDGDLITGMSNPSRNRIIVEHELDGTYVLRHIAESDKVKAFPKLIEDIRRLISEQK